MQKIEVMTDVENASSESGLQKEILIGLEDVRYA